MHFKDLFIFFWKGAGEMNSNEEVHKKEPFNVYCNGIEVSMGRYDFSFLISQNSPKGGNYLGEIVMSPEHAKVFANMLLTNVQHFEEVFGIIPELNEEKMNKLKKDGKIVIEGNENE